MTILTTIRLLTPESQRTSGQSSRAVNSDYDAMGNRTSATIASQGGGSFTYGATTTANQYTSITGRSAITHDANGNQLLNGAGAAFTWDSENRLLTVTPVSPNLGDKAHVHSYDGLHRRVTRTTREWTSSGWTNLETTYFIYDGWNVIEEWTSTFSPATTATLTRRLTWGQDLAGSPSLQGAGGVGGLLMVEEITSTTNEAYHFHYDGNGNVTEITDRLGVSVATYRYDAFGNTLVATGTYAATNRYRFSTKPLDHEVTTAPLYYYGYRYLDPLTGRWPSRDPIEEDGGINLYGFVENLPISRSDFLGMRPWDNAADAKAAMKKALKDAHDKSLAAGKAEIDARTGKKAEWHTLRDGVGLNHVSIYWSGGGKVADFIEVVLAREFGAETYCFVESGQKKYDHSDPYGAKMPTLAEAKQGWLGTLTVPPNYFSAKEYAPPDRRPTAKLIAEAHTHPEFWKLTLGTAGVDPVRAKSKVGPSREDKIAAGAIERVVGHAVEHLVYDDNAPGGASTGYIWHAYGPMH